MTLFDEGGGISHSPGSVFKEKLLLLRWHKPEEGSRLAVVVIVILTIVVVENVTAAL